MSDRCPIRKYTVYHGGTAPYTELCYGTGKDGDGIYTTFDLNRAQMYAQGTARVRGEPKGYILELEVELDPAHVWDDACERDLRDFADVDAWVLEGRWNPAWPTRTDGGNARIYLGFVQEGDRSLVRMGYQAIKTTLPDLIILDSKIIKAIRVHSEHEPLQ